MLVIFISSWIIVVVISWNGFDLLILSAMKGSLHPDMGWLINFEFKFLGKYHQKNLGVNDKFKGNWVKLKKISFDNWNRIKLNISIKMF